MARKVVWTKEAISDLEALAEYITKDSAFYAMAFIQEILDAGRSLKELSKRGRIVPELSSPSIRELFVKEYRLIYSIQETQVVVLALIHSRRDLKKLWEKKSK